MIYVYFSSQRSILPQIPNNQNHQNKLVGIFLQEEQSTQSIQQPQITQFLLVPYMTYSDSENNTIREYKMFSNMNPTQKNHSGRLNYFDKKDFITNLSKYDLQQFPTYWTNGKEHLGNLEKDSNGNIKYKHGWPLSKANYNFIQTNQPTNTSKMMTYDIHEENSFCNKSNCFLNGVANQDFKAIIDTSKINAKTPYIRLITKNLELKFNWIKFITSEFKDYLTSSNEIPNYKIIINNLDLSSNQHLHKQRQFINDFAPNIIINPQPGNKIKQAIYKNDDQTIDYIIEYHLHTGNKIKQTSYQNDGKSINSIAEYNPYTGNLTKLTVYQADGQTIWYMNEFDPQTGDFINLTFPTS